MTDPDRVLQAFRRLLSDASEGGQAKVDALVALSQRTVWVPTWGPDDEGFRTLVNSDGDAALPVFTAGDTMQDAAMRFGWRQPDGSVPSKEVGARAALRHAVAHELPYVVVDIGSQHSLEVERHELEPLMSPGASRSSSGPYAAVGKVSSSMLRAVRPTPRPESMEAVDPSAPPQTQQSPAHSEGHAEGAHRYHDSQRPPPPAPPPGTATPPTDTGAAPPTHTGAAPPTHTGAAGTASPPTHTGAAGVTVNGGTPGAAGAPGASATFGSGTSVALHPLRETPSDRLLDALSTVLRGYPEVEWAALCAASRGPAEPVPTVGLRVDTSFRQRINEIIAAIKQSGDENGATLDVLLLDDPELMRSARHDALVFYPWRRR